ncbi:hypothetical protein AAAC51_39555 [Priestia megaterium]
MNVYSQHRGEKNDRIKKKVPHPQETKSRDHAEHYPTENKTLFDRFKIEQTVDSIPIEEIKIEKEDERNKRKLKMNPQLKINIRRVNVKPIA